MTGWLRRHGRLLLGAVLAASVLLAALGSLRWQQQSLAMDIPHKLQPPSGAHLMGTDPFGRDVALRVLTGAGPALAVGVGAAMLGALVGGLLGALSGYLGGWWDEGVMRLMDTLYAFPVLLLALVVVAVWGGGLGHTTVALGAAFVPVFARLVRGSVLELRQREHVLAAEAIGASPARRLWRHILPLAVGPLLVQFTTAFAGAVLAEASLSYLGLGVVPPAASWGRMLQESQTFVAVAPWNAYFPGLAIAWTVLAGGLLGDGLGDLLQRR